MDTQALIKDLREEGAVVIPSRLDSRETLEVLAYMAQRPVYPDAHIPETARKRGDLRTFSRDPKYVGDRFCIDLEDAVLAPVLFERALALTDVAAAYLEVETPLSYSSNAFWTRPGHIPHADIQDFHRDVDDARFLALFCYLSDVHADADGPHKLKGPAGLRVVGGPAGTMFLADTRHEHLGLKPTRGTRGIWWWRWGVSDPPESYKWDKNAPIPSARLGDRYPADPRLRESLRLLVTP